MLIWYERVLPWCPKLILKRHFFFRGSDVTVCTILASLVGFVLRGMSPISSESFSLIRFQKMTDRQLNHKSFESNIKGLNGNGDLYHFKEPNKEQSFDGGEEHPRPPRGLPEARDEAQLGSSRNSFWTQGS